MWTVRDKKTCIRNDLESMIFLPGGHTAVIKLQVLQGVMGVLILKTLFLWNNLGCILQGEQADESVEIENTAAIKDLLRIKYTDFGRLSS